MGLRKSPNNMVCFGDSLALTILFVVSLFLSLAWQTVNANQSSVITPPDTETTNTETQNTILEQAYTIRSSRPVESVALLDSLDRSLLTTAQKDTYDFLRAYSKYINSDFEGAIESLRALAENTRDFKQSVRAKAFMLALNGALQKWSNAFDLLDELSQITKQIDDIETEESVHVGIINFYLQIDEHQLNAAYISPLLNGDYSLRFKCNAHLQYLSSMLEFAPQDLDETNFSEARSLCKDLDDPIIVNAIHGMYARYFYYSDEFEKSIAVVNKYLPVVETLVYKPVIDEFYELKSRLSFINGNLEDAKQYAYKILKDVNPDTVSISIINAHKTLYEVEKKLGNFETALWHHENYAKAESRSITKDTAKLLSVQNAKRNVEEKQVKIELLDKENSLLKTGALLAQKDANNRILIIALMLVSICFVIILLYKMHENYISMRDLSRKDSLTDIANRHYFTTMANQIIEHAKFNNLHVSLIVFDLDDFKQVNDQFGHLVGDEALKVCVEATNRVLRNSDLFGRLGGEEFGIILSGCDTEKAAKIADDVRCSIYKMNEERDLKYSLSASFGVASVSDGDYRYESIFELADSKLYQAKADGKNKVAS